VRLTDVAERNVRGYSHGMRQRLGLAEVVMKQARVAILDEPTSGLDPQSTREFLDMIRGLKADGVAVLLSSHLLGQVQAICDRVLLFRQGRIALQGTLSELAREVLGGGYAIHVETSAADAPLLLKRLPGVRDVLLEGDGRIRVVADSDPRTEVAKVLVAEGASLRQLTVVEPSLDDIYNRYFATASAAA
jgi:ABC-2 type transport system ATP-binding protein